LHLVAARLEQAASLNKVTHFRRFAAGLSFFYEQEGKPLDQCVAACSAPRGAVTLA
jgi:hypothetical protein